MLSATVGALVSFFMMPFLVSHLGTRWYGVWISVGSLVGGFYLLDLGLSTAVTRYVTEALSKGDSNRANSVISTTFWIYCGLGGILALISCLMAVLVPLIIGQDDNIDLIRILLIIAGLTLAIGFPFKAFAGIIQAKFRFDLLAIMQLVVLATATGLTVYLVTVGYGVLALAVVGLLASVISDLGFFAISRQVFPELDIRFKNFSRELAREIFSFSIWAFLINLSNQIRLRIDFLVVAGVQSAVAVTHYAVGSRIAETANEFLYQATNMVQPIVTRYHATQNYTSMRWALIFLTKINTTLGVFVAGMLIILGGPFIVRWMSSSFIDSVLVLYFLTAALTIGLIVNPLEYTLIAILRHRFLAIVNVADAAANLGLSILFGMLLGLPGVALGTLLPMIVTRFFIIAPYGCRQTGVPIQSYVLSILLPLASAMLILLPIALTSRPFLPGSGYTMFTFIVVVSAIFYAPIMFYMVFDSSEREHLLHAVRGIVFNRINQ